MNYIRMVGCTFRDIPEDYVDLKDDGFIIIDRVAGELVGLVSSWEEVNEIKNLVSATSYSATTSKFTVKPFSEVPHIPTYLFRGKIDVYHRTREIIDFGHKCIGNGENGKIYEKIN